MYYSKTFIPTLKDVKADYDSTIKLLNKAGMFRGRGIREGVFLPLGCKIINKFKKLIENSLRNNGFEWIYVGNCPYYIDFIANEIKSYKDLPQNFYDIDGKGNFRILMFTGDRDKHRDELLKGICDVLTGISLEYTFLEAEGAVFVEKQKGNKKIVECGCGCTGYDSVITLSEQKDNEEEPAEKKKVKTPQITTIKALSHFLQIAPPKTLKTLIFVGEKEEGKTEPFLVLLRGDRSLNENRLKKALPQYCSIRIADEATVQKVTSAPLGFAGPVDPKMDVKIYADLEVKTMKNMVTGANEEDYHYINVNLGRDIDVDEFMFLRNVEQGEKCIKCGKPINIKQGVFLAETDETTGVLQYTDEKGNIKTGRVISIEVNTLLLLEQIIKQYSTSKHVVNLPRELSPYDVEIIMIKPKDAKHIEAERFLRSSLEKRKYEVLTDDRDISPGSKFNDADLLGIPVKIVIGPRSLKANRGEIRYEDDKVLELEIEKIPDKIKDIVTTKA